MNLYLVRHGETEWNRQGKLQGQADIPLNAEGELQALRLREKLEEIQFKKAYCSDLSRAIKTAEIVLGSREIELIQTDLLREITFGSWSGKEATALREYLKSRAPNSPSTREECLHFKWDDVESYNEVYRRFQRFMEKHLFDDPSSTILISTHGGLIRSILYHLDFRAGFKWVVPNCSFLKLQVAKEGQIDLVGYEGISLLKGLVF